MTIAMAGVILLGGLIVLVALCQTIVDTFRINRRAKPITEELPTKMK